MMGTKNIITPWSFRDGRDYVISLSVGENSSSLSLKVTDRITAEEWTCQYDTEYIESLTQRTGSFKPFDVFVSMIKSAILKKSEAVALEMMNIDDLEVLRTQRRQSSVTTIGPASQPYINEKSKSANSVNSKKKYLIVTYVAEFDKVHYPIPLNYSGPPDPIIMQNNIKKLKSEVSTLRNAKVALEEEVHFLKQGNQTPNNPTPVESNIISEDISFLQNHQKHRHHEGVDMIHYSHPEDEAKIHKLMSIIQKLEEKIRSERADYLFRIDKLGAENDFLRLKLEAAEKYGIELKSEIHQHEKQIATLNDALQKLQEQQHLKGNSQRYEYNLRDRDGNNNVRSGHYRPNYQDVRAGRNGFNNNANRRARCSSTESCRSGKGGDNYRGMTQTTSNKKDNNIHSRYGQSPSGIFPRTRSNSPAEPRGGRPRFQANPRSRSSSKSPARSIFDPTAYIAEKKMRQENMAQLRLENIKKRLQLESGSSRSRSNSRDSNVLNRTCRTRNLVAAACSICGLRCSGQCNRNSNKRREKPDVESILLQTIDQPRRKVNSVDVLLNEADQISRREDCQPNSPNCYRRQSPSPPPLNRSTTRTMPDKFQGSRNNGNSQRDVEISEDRTNLKTYSKSSGNVMPGLNISQKKGHSLLKPGYSRKTNSTSGTGTSSKTRIYQEDLHSDKNSKLSRQIRLQKKVAALQTFLEKTRK